VLESTAIVEHACIHYTATDKKSKINKLVRDIIIGNNEVTYEFAKGVKINHVPVFNFMHDTKMSTQNIIMF